MTDRTLRMPCRWPRIRGSRRPWAQRPLPSMMMATSRGNCPGLSPSAAIRARPSGEIDVFDINSGAECQDPSAGPAASASLSTLNEDGLAAFGADRDDRDGEADLPGEEVDIVARPRRQV